MKTLEITKTAEKQIAQIKTLVENGLDSLRQAGEMIVNLLEQGYTAKLISSLSGYMSVRDVQDLARIGNGTMAPALFTITTPAVKYLQEAPIEVQSEIVENGVDVIVEDSGKFVKRRFKLNELNHKTCRYVFDNGKVRSLAAQKRSLLSQEVKVKLEPWTIEEGKLKVNSRCSFSINDLKTIIKNL